jgi:hypothetical protein
MTWLESWEGSYNGDWYGSQEPEPLGAMRATLRGSAVLSGTLTTGTEVENTFGLGWGVQRKRKIQQDDEMIIQIILQSAPFVL